MDDKIYLQHRTEYLLQKAIESETEKIKEAMAHNANADVSHCYTEIGILVALKNQAKDLIKKL